MIAATGGKNASIIAEESDRSDHDCLLWIAAASPLTIYIWRVVGKCGEEGQINWSRLTLAPRATPMFLEAIAIDGN